MKRRIAFSLLATIGFALIGAQKAEAGALDRILGHGSCCEQSCCKPACCDPCDPCCRRPFRPFHGLFQHRCCKPACCEPVCCEPKCCDPCDPCCRSRIRPFHRLFHHRCCKPACCDPCGAPCCDGASAEAAPAPMPGK